MNCIQIIQKYNLQDFYEYFSRNNISNDLPYHNRIHTETMIKNVYDGASYYNLNIVETKELVIAALFHDFNHSGGKLTDKENINLVLTELDKISDMFAKHDIELQKIKDMVYITEFPFVHFPKTLQQKIIRDSDLMQSFSTLEMVINGLAEELTHKFGKKLSKKEMCDGQIKFMEESIFYTSWGLKIFEKLWPETKIKILEMRNHDI